MFDLVNIFFLICGLILGIIIYYIIERIKEGRLRKNIAEVLKNEIIVCSKDANKELESIEKIDSSESPENIQIERIYLGAFLLSQSLYGTNVYESYMDKLYLFKGNTQEAIIGFYNIVFKIKRDIGSIRPLVEEAKYPAQAVKDLYEIQSKLRENALKISYNCIMALEKERKNKSIYEFIKLEEGMNKAQKVIASIWLFFSSLLLIVKGVTTESFILFLIGQTLFFAALFVLFGLKRKVNNVKNKKE